MVEGVEWELDMERASAQTLGVWEAVVGVGWEVACDVRTGFAQSLGVWVAAAVLEHSRGCLRQSLTRLD